MTENVALIKKKQKSFSKSVEKTKIKIETGDIKIAEKTPTKFKKSFKGVIYISNIPHGFYEKEITGYFGQFGTVLKARVARSKRTGNSKGHAFVMFKNQEVAKIAAETMNNYLMDKRLIKAKFLPNDEKTKDLFRKPNFSKEHYPTKVRRTRFKKSFNAAVPEEKQKTKVNKAIKHIKKVTNKLKEAGIDYNFTSANIPKSEEKDNIADDSSSEDIIFTTPEEMKKKAEKQVKLKNKRKGKDNEDTPSPIKAKKSKIISIANTENDSNSVKEKKQKKENKNKENILIENKNIKDKKDKKKNKLESVKNNRITPIKGNKNKRVNPNSIENIENNTNENNENTKAKKEKVNKNNDIHTNDNNTNLLIKMKIEKKQHNKIENIENSANENNENIKKEKRSKKNVQNDDSVNIIENVGKTGKIDKEKMKNKNVSNKIVGITKKLKKVQKSAKISDKKASLIMGQIKTSDQVKTVKKIDKIKKKKITKV